MSKIEVNEIVPQSGTTLTLGGSGDTLSIASGVTSSFPSLTVSGDLTVDTNTLYVDSTNNRVGIGTTSPSFNLHISSSSDAVMNLKASGQANGLHISQLTADGGNSINATNNNYLQFSTNNTERMRISSTGKVGIGTSSPTYRLEVEESGGRARFKFNSTAAFLDIKQGRIDATNNVRLESGGTTSTYLEYRGYLGHIWDVDTTERMRIDSSGNVGIGTSSPSYRLHVDGNDGTDPLLWLKQNNNGIGGLRLTRQNGSDVQNGDWQIDHSSQGLMFKHSPIANAISAPSWTTVLNIEGNNNGYDILPQDAVTSLGSPTNRFDDLYLNGELYVGGTGSANALDDYEEGTWTASYGTSGSTTGYYTKVGRLVTLHVILTGTSQTFDQITGLPFSSDLATGAVTFGRLLSVGAGKDRSNVGGNTSGSVLYLYNENATSSSLTTGSGTVRLDITVTYLTNS